MARPRRLRYNELRGGVLGIVLAHWAVVFLSSGCSSTSWTLFKRHPSSQTCLDLALEGETADERRRGVNGLASGKDASSEWVVKVFDTVARTDTDPMVRSAALRGLSRSAGAGSIPTAIRILNSTTTRYRDVRPAPAVVRWEAARLLLDIVDGYAYDESQRSKIVDVLLDRLRNDPDRNVRLACIDAVAYFAQRPIPSVLIDVMESDDFAVRHAAEQALIALTGVTQHHDPDAWRAWLADQDDPFGHAGETPAELARDGGHHWWPW